MIVFSVHNLRVNSGLWPQIQNHSLLHYITLLTKVGMGWSGFVYVSWRGWGVAFISLRLLKGHTICVVMVRAARKERGNKQQGLISLFTLSSFNTQCDPFVTGFNNAGQ